MMVSIKRELRIKTNYGFGSIVGYNDNVVSVMLDKAAIIDKEDKLNRAHDTAMLPADLPNDEVLITRTLAEEWLLNDYLSEKMVNDLRENRDKIA